MVAVSLGTNEPSIRGGSQIRDYYLDLISLGMLFLAVAIVFLANPFLFSDFRFWIEEMASNGTLSRPPSGLITSAAFFFGLLGVSGFVQAAIRLRLVKFSRRVLADILSGIALVVFAYLIALYSSHVITLLLTLVIEVAVCGILLISYGVMLFVFFKER